MTQPSLSKPVARELAKTKGVEFHNGKLRINFQFRGKRCREVLPYTITVPSVRAAANLRARILDDIARGSFVYGEHFPNSKAALQVDCADGKRRTVGQGVALWLAAKEVKTAPCTFRNYKSKALIHVEPSWGTRPIDTITKAEMEAWQAGLIADGYKAKTVNDIMTVIRGVFRDAFVDGVIDRNIMDRIGNLDTRGNQSGANPFTREELARIAATPTKRKSELNMIMFCCWTGLSVSELIALAWEDIDLENMTMHIRRARVDGEFKVPKEAKRDRVIEIIEPAREWLQAQRAISQVMPPVTVAVRQRDNVSMVNEDIRPVWINSTSRTFHANDWAISKRFLEAHLKRAKVPYRAVNQCRHTFASQMLSLYMNEQWIANQLGHGSTEMLRRHYGKFMPKEAPRMSDRVMQQLERAEA